MNGLNFKIAFFSMHILLKFSRFASSARRPSIFSITIQILILLVCKHVIINVLIKNKHGNMLIVEELLNPIKGKMEHEFM